jgi:DNA adenine methylase
MKIITSPLRYPGGKSSLTGFLAATLQCNGLAGGTYIEPFCGGAGVAINLLLSGYVNNIIINDIDPFIYAFWHSALHETEAFISLIDKTPVTIDEWHRQKIISKTPNIPTLQLGFATFYLNRCNRSGILGANPIGGLQQTGEWKIDARYNKVALITRIEKIAEKRNSIRIENKDILSFLTDVIQSLADRSFIYLDPPYIKQGPALYLNALSVDGHTALAKLLVNECRHVWLLTYDSTEKAKSLYADVVVHPFALNYSAHRHKKGEELLIHPPHTIIPFDFDTDGSLNKLTFLDYSDNAEQCASTSI